MDPGIKHKKTTHYSFGILFLFLSAGLIGTACSFDYGDAVETNKGRPDIVMDNLEYVRVRGGDPLARIQADHAERWEENQTMELHDFTFEQMDDHGNNVNADGRAGLAIVQLGSGDISLKGGVKIRVDSEDVIITTSELEWKDKEKILYGENESEVDIERSDGTIFSGIGFYANARSRIWSFAGEVKGTYVEKDDDEDEGEKTEKTVVFNEDQNIEKLTDEPELFIPAAEEYLFTEERFSRDSELSTSTKEQISAPKPFIPDSKPSFSEPAQYPEPRPAIPAQSQKSMKQPGDM